MDATERGPVESVFPQPIPFWRRQNRRRSRSNCSEKDIREIDKVKEALNLLKSCGQSILIVKVEKNTGFVVDEKR